MEKLVELRSQVDQCDQELAKILEKRLSIIKQIMYEKKDMGVPIFNSDREKEVVHRIGDYVEQAEFKGEIKNIHTHVLRSCRRIQSRYLFPYHIVLAGFMGTGKTTVGRELAKMLAMDQIDIDKVIEDRTRMTIAQIFETHGEAYFRELEFKTVEEMSDHKNIIIFCSGGGTVLNEKNVDNLKKNGVIVWLKASPEIILERVSAENTRPLLKNDMTIGKIESILNPRMALYQKAADIAIDTDGKSVTDIGLEIVEQLMHLKLDRVLPNIYKDRL